MVSVGWFMALGLSECFQNDLSKRLQATPSKAGIAPEKLDGAIRTGRDRE